MTVVTEFHGEWTIYSGGQSRKIQDIVGFFKKAVETSETFYIYDMDLYVKDLIDIFLESGFQDITDDRVQNPRKKFPIGSFWYIIGELGDSFEIQGIVDYKDKKPQNVVFRNLNKKIPVRPDEIVQHFGGNSISEGYYKAIKTLENLGCDGITISSDSYHGWKQTFHPSDFNTLFKDSKKQEVHGKTLDEYLRPSYKGGFNFLKPGIYGKQVGGGIVLDVNSLYPYIMEKPLPAGSPKEWEGDIPESVKKMYEKKRIYYYVHLKCDLTLKKGKIPFISTKDVRYSDYIESGKDVELTLSCDDYELMEEQYNVSHETIIDGVYFLTYGNLFYRFVERFYKIKKESKDPAARKISKMILNSLSGNLSKRPTRNNISYTSGKVHIMKTINPSPSLIYVGSAVTSKARRLVIETAQKNCDRFLYSDTDSLHLLRNDIPDGIKVSDKIGDWKIEKTFKRGIYYKKKVYILEQEDGMKVTIAGLGYESKKNVENALNRKVEVVPDGIDPDTWRRIALKLSFLSLGSLDDFDKMEIPYIETYACNFRKFKKIRMGELTKEPKNSRVDVDELMKIRYEREREQKWQASLQ